MNCEPDVLCITPCLLTKWSLFKLHIQECAQMRLAGFLTFYIRLRLSSLVIAFKLCKNVYRWAGFLTFHTRLSCTFIFSYCNNQLAHILYLILNIFFLLLFHQRDTDTFHSFHGKLIVTLCIEKPPYVSTAPISNSCECPGVFSSIYNV